ncbi:hypothetical protein [Nocardioides sp.]|uniref:hypothetical protein n=1 Tax=Nocardioides sp. TaxID=35761 RepID=UPI00261B96E3|nr:hypothetical protein [Nocardioides sp.]
MARPARLSGRWGFSSGSAHARGALLGGLILGEDGNPTDYACFLVLSEDYTIDDLWDTMGLRGTGSNDIIVEDAFVPAHRMLSMNDSFHCTVPGASFHANPLYRIPLFSIMATTITTPLMGMATGAYDAHVAQQRDRVRVYGGDAVRDDPFAKVRIAEAGSDIEAGWQQMMANVRAIASTAQAGEPITIEQRIQLRRDQVRAGQRATQAIDKLFESAGAKAIASSSPLQRFWRDAHAARVHVANDPDLPLKIYGDVTFGGTVDGGML